MHEGGIGRSFACTAHAYLSWRGDRPAGDVACWRGREVESRRRSLPLSELLTSLLAARIPPARFHPHINTWLRRTDRFRQSYIAYIDPHPRIA